MQCLIRTLGSSRFPMGISPILPSFSTVRLASSTQCLKLPKLDLIVR